MFELKFLDLYLKGCLMNQFDEIAADYDESIYPLSERDFVLPTVEKLAELAPGKKILELAVGTGRIANPLAQRGFDMTGLDISEQMLKQLKQKKDGKQVEIVLGDMQIADLNEEFDLIYLIFNSITYIKTLEGQLATIQNAAKHLKPDGLFVLESFVPRVHEIVGDEIAPFSLEDDFIGFDQYERISQQITSYQFDLSGEHVASHKTVHRYIWPSELQLMGKLAGLEIIHQWGNWQGEPLKQEDDDMIMVFKKNT